MTLRAASLAYYERTVCSPQWLEFNRAMAIELTAGLPTEENHRLFARIGERVAQRLPVSRCEGLAELENAFNARWEAIGWGFCQLRETSSALAITHACSPLASAFGHEAVGWTQGFLEGAYDQWFRAQGSPSTLRVRVAAAAEGAADSQIELALGRFSA